MDMKSAAPLILAALGGAIAATALSSSRSGARAKKGPDSSLCRLTYFHGWGLAEQVRWVLAATGVVWEQVGLDSRDEFLDLRDTQCKFLFGQMPLLEIDGLQLVQSQAMVRYVARRGGLCPEDPAELVLCDMVAEAVKDARGCLTAAPFQGSPGDASHAAHMEKLPPLFLKYFTRFEKILAAGGGTVLKSGRICYADVLLTEMFHGYSSLSPGCLRPYPLCSALMGAVTSMSPVAAYLDDPKRRYPYPEGEGAIRYKNNVNTVLGR